MIDDPPPATRGEPDHPWLSPTEALTRFVASNQRRRQPTLTRAPTRFGFRIGDIGLLVPAGMLSELVEEIAIYPLPTTPGWFLGLINLRGSLIPVFDLKALFALEDEGGEESRLLVLDKEGRAVGLLIEALPQTVEIGSPLPQSPPLPSLLQEHSHAAYMQDQELWVEFDFDGFFQAIGNRLAV